MRHSPALPLLLLVLLLAGTTRARYQVIYQPLQQSQEVGFTESSRGPLVVSCQGRLFPSPTLAGWPFADHQSGSTPLIQQAPFPGSRTLLLPRVHASRQCFPHRDSSDVCRTSAATTTSTTMAMTWFTVMKAGGATLARLPCHRNHPGMASAACWIGGWGGVALLSM